MDLPEEHSIGQFGKKNNANGGITVALNGHDDGLYDNNHDDNDHVADEPQEE